MQSSPAPAPLSPGSGATLVTLLLLLLLLFITADKYKAVRVDGESVLFIGTQFSNLYTAVDTPAKGRVGRRIVEDMCYEIRRASAFVD